MLSAPVRALPRLLEPQNNNLNWLLGNLLRERARHPNWYHCVPLVQLEKGSQHAEAAWNGLIGTCRALLEDEAEAPQRAREVLNPADCEFDLKTDDFVAELVAIWQLGREGLGRFHFLPAGDRQMPDLRALRGSESVDIEVKNLRLPDSIEAAAFGRWYLNQACYPERFRFDVSLDYESDPGALNRPQKEVLERAIDALPDAASLKSRIQLPGNLEITFTIMEGKGHMVSFGGSGVMLDDRYYADGRQRLILKALEQIRKGLSQLYNPSIPQEVQKLLFLRWKVPDDLAVDPEEIRRTVREELQISLGRFFPRLEIRIAHNYEE